MKLLTDDENFREYLMGLNELRVCEVGNSYIPTEIKRQSLIDFSEDIGEFLTDNSNANFVDTEAPEELQRLQINTYIQGLSRSKVCEVYSNYVESYCVIEDLMILNEHNRLELITHVTKHSFEYLELLNREVLN
jgi:phosphoenolpyruvate carboxylase